MVAAPPPVPWGPRAAASSWAAAAGRRLTRSAPTRFRANWLKKSPDGGVTGSVSSAVAGLPYQSSASFWAGAGGRGWGGGGGGGSGRAGHHTAHGRKNSGCGGRQRGTSRRWQDACVAALARVSAGAPRSWSGGSCVPCSASRRAARHAVASSRGPPRLYGPGHGGRAGAQRQIRSVRSGGGRVGANERDAGLTWLGSGLNAVVSAVEAITSAALLMAIVCEFWSNQPVD